jgi:hypothetical protein
MCYAEKLLISGQDRLSPMHTHVLEAEDIIDCGGATLAVQLHGSDGAGSFAEDWSVRVLCDGIARDVAPGGVLKLAPGESVARMPGDWHAFWGERGEVLIGEVSTVNDDEPDSLFRDPIGRFSDVEEDAPADRLLVSDYAARFQTGTRSEDCGRVSGPPRETGSTWRHGFGPVQEDRRWPGSVSRRRRSSPSCGGWRSCRGEGARWWMRSAGSALPR